MVSTELRTAQYGQTGVMLAATHGQIEILRILLGEGAGMDATAKHGLSALMLAVVNHHVECAMLLIDAGASIYLQGSGAPGFAGKTAHDLAVQNGQGDLAAYIARAGEKDSS